MKRKPVIQEDVDNEFSMLMSMKASVEEWEDLSRRASFLNPKTEYGRHQQRQTLDLIEAHIRKLKSQ